MKRFTRLSAALLLAGCLQSTAAAQGVLDDTYGRGVHAYFAADYARAQEWLTAAVDAGSQDPRVFYFRGLTSVAIAGGAFDAGAADFDKAANLEVSGGRVVNVNRALERIQGYTRSLIEDLRLRVRVANKDKLPREPIGPVTGPGVLPLDPFADDGGLTTGDPAEVVVPPVDVDPLAPAADPLAPSPAVVEPAAPLDTTDPFATPPDTTPATDPFGETPAPAADPFGGDAATEPEAADSSTNPFGDDAAPAAADDNPFGN